MPRLDAEVVNAFVDPVVHAIKTCLGLDTEVVRLELVDSLDPPPSLSVAIDLAGSLNGPVTWVFSEPLARQVAAGLLCQPADEVDAASCTDAVAELANIVSGNATGRLHDAGYRVEIQPPRVIHETERSLGDQLLAVSLTTRVGGIRIVIGVQGEPAVGAEVVA